MGFADLFDLRGFSDTPELLKLTVDLQPAADFNGFQLAERDAAPLCVLKIIVEDGKAPEEVFSVKLGYVPVTAADEEVQVDKLLLQSLGIFDSLSSVGVFHIAITSFFGSEFSRFEFLRAPRPYTAHKFRGSQRSRWTHNRAF